MQTDLDLSAITITTDVKRNIGASDDYLTKREQKEIQEKIKNDRREKMEEVKELVKKEMQDEFAKKVK